ncbi:polysaccharide lyase [Pelagicoccus albus]|uniref:Polysaccharide lyase 14 domain-containing protein n=1 Tax=Pelagicoccus albus TaxID=415222 RepID=A0A7X1B885_9BACT|nr:hypothetical protein [Pelagicoccus albus]MBC2607480.1 hypothetical protein [Pelagicoccus albus]
MRAILSVFVFLLLVKLSIAAGGDVNYAEPLLQARDDVIFYGGFDDAFNTPEWEKAWGLQWVNRGETLSLAESTIDTGKALRVTYPRDAVGPSQSGTQFPIVLDDIDNIEQPYHRSLYLRYYVKFEQGFDFRLGGKLPGLMGGADSWSRSGGNQPDGTNGWTLRFMWRQGGELVVYAYLPKSKNGKWGEDKWGQDIETGFTAKSGQWICMEQYVDIGTPGQDDGVLKVWINGEERLSIQDMRFWDIENDHGKIGGLYFSTFHGGNTPEWAPSVDSFALFDGLVLSTKRVGPYAVQD